MKFILKILKSNWGIFFLLLILIVANVIASIWHARIDLTNEKRFTLSKNTKTLLARLNQPVKITVLLKGNYPSGFKKLASSTEDILREFKEVAGNNFRYQFSTSEDEFEDQHTTYGDSLSSLGFYPINLTSQLKDGQQQQVIYPIALLQYENRLLPIELYKGKTPLINFKELNSAEALLEYNIASTIAKIMQVQKSTIGYAIGNGEPMDMSVYDLSENVLKPNYNVQLINIAQQPFINPACEALLIVKPSLGFSEFEKLKIDQYVTHGGKVLFFLDRLSAEMDSLQIKNEVIAYDRNLNLNDLLFKYGVRINANLLMDLQCDYLPFDINGNGQFEFLPWNYFPVLESPENHPINKNIGFVSGQFTNTIDTVEAEGVKKTIILQSSVNARSISTPALISGNENVAAPEDEKYNLSNLPVAVLLEGKFKSLYAHRLTNEMNDSIQKSGMSYLANCVATNKILVVADGDIVLNSVSKGNQPLAMGMNRYTAGSQREFPFANKSFLLNALEFMVNDYGLSDAKSKEYTIQLLDTKKLEETRIIWQMCNIILPILLVIIFALVFQWFRKRKHVI